MYTVIDFVYKYGKYYWGQKSERHWIDSVRKMERFCRFKDYQEKSIDSYKPTDIYDFFNHLEENGLSDSTINRYTAAISSTFKFAVEQGVMDKRDLPIIRWRKVVNEARPRYFSDKEIQTIDKKLANHPCHSWMVHYFRIALITGMRRGEIISIGKNPSDLHHKATYGVVDKNKKTVTLYRTKNGKTRVVRMKAAWESLKKLNFKPGSFYTDHRFYTTWREVAKSVCDGDEAKLEHFVFHVTRHTCASRMINKYNMPTLKVQMKLGHESITTTQKYVHNADEQTTETEDEMMANDYNFTEVA
jgi:integrase